MRNTSTLNFPSFFGLTALINHGWITEQTNQAEKGSQIVTR